MLVAVVIRRTISSAIGEVEEIFSAVIARRVSAITNRAMLALFTEPEMLAITAVATIDNIAGDIERMSSTVVCVRALQIAARHLLVVRRARVAVLIRVKINGAHSASRPAPIIATITLAFGAIHKCSSLSGSRVGATTAVFCRGATTTAMRKPAEICAALVAKRATKRLGTDFATIAGKLFPARAVATASRISGRKQGMIDARTVVFYRAQPSTVRIFIVTADARSTTVRAVK